MEIGYGDILLNSDSEIYSVNGDLAVGNGKAQQVGAIVNANQGNFRSWPTLAANISKHSDGPNNSRDIVADVVGALGSDGWRVDELDILGTQETLEVTISQVEKITDNTSSLL